MESRRETVLLDMDNTLMDFNDAALKNVPIGVVERFFEPGNPYVARPFPPEWRQIIEQTYNDPEFFANLEPLPGAVDAWKAMLDHGYHPRILSSPLGSNPNSIEGKLESLRRHFVPRFGEEVVKAAIFDSKKWKYPGLALIDDRPGANKGNPAPWTQIVFGEQPGSVEIARHLPSWDNPEDILIPMLDEIRDIQTAQN